MDRRCLLLLFLSWLCSLSHAMATSTLPPPALASATPARSWGPSRLPVRAVSLGGWLVTEGWILPSLFDGIPNKDLLDGTQLQFKSVAWNTYLAAEQGGGGAVVAKGTTASGGETFKLWRIDETTFNLRASGGQFVGVRSDGAVVATAAVPGQPETFKLLRNAGDMNKTRIMAPNGLFLQAKKDGTVAADYAGEGWSVGDPSVFALLRAGEMRGEYQICNGYGTSRATPVLRNHWSTYIVEDDFKFIAESGLTAVRIPVGWWIASDPNPPPPYVGGSLEALDKAFKWAELHNLGVIVDLHAAPGCQNPWEHSSSRDGTQAWGATDASIAQTVQVIDFLAARYAESPSLLAVELLNEPLGPVASLESLKKYYRDGYNAVRKHSPEAYVVMANRLGIGAGEVGELVGFAGQFPGAVLDLHYYTVFNGLLAHSTAQQNIDFVRTNFSAQISAVTLQNGPLTFIGEWASEWKVANATTVELQDFGKAQMEVYGKATFGWSYWTLKNVNHHWSLEWMINNGFISLKPSPN